MSGPWYDTAQICLNGHIVNKETFSSPERNQEYCDKCGIKTITACPECNAPIKGYYNVPRVVSIGGYRKPSYCHNCGKPYPWTVSSIQAASELADELDDLNSSEKQQLKDSFSDLIQNTPKSVVAETRFKKIIKKAGTEAYQEMKSILIEIVSESVKKSLFGSNNIT